MNYFLIFILFFLTFHHSFLFRPLKSAVDKVEGVFKVNSKAFFNADQKLFEFSEKEF